MRVPLKGPGGCLPFILCETSGEAGLRQGGGGGGQGEVGIQDCWLNEITQSRLIIEIGKKELLEHEERKRYEAPPYH